jgi:GNAT superfamily N-acetyltransferase
MSAPGGIEVSRVPIEAILEMRELYRREMDCQIVHDSFHARGFTDSWLLRRDNAVAGYGSVAGEPNGPREVLKEFFLLPAHRGSATEFLGGLIAASGACWIEAQTNDPQLAPLVDAVARDLARDTILFADSFTSRHTAPGAAFRQLSDADRERAFAHTLEPVGEWGIEAGGEIVATGGWLTHYNPPWADLYMEVAESHRERGYGRFLVQELKRECRERGLRPAARCRHDNEASRRTLQSSGMMPCAHIVRGRIPQEER